MSMQENKANFDVSHELDEFMMVEKPLTHHRRKKANMDPEKMKPEMRQLEEQYVFFCYFIVPPSLKNHFSDRFTVYNSSHNNRKSYYPHNQPIVTKIRSDQVGEEAPEPVTQSATNTILPTATIIDRSQAGSPLPEEDRTQRMPVPQAPSALPRASSS